MSVDKDRIEQLLDCLDGRGSSAEWTAIRELQQVLQNDFPTYLLARFRVARKLGARASCVYHATRYAREGQDTVEIGKAAINDRAKVVRYRGCLLLAYSLRKDVLPFLRDAAVRVPKVSHADVMAAIDAIEHQNHHYFADRDHSGKVTLNITPPG